MAKREYQVRVEIDGQPDEVFSFTSKQKAVTKYNSIRWAGYKRQADTLKYHGTRAAALHAELVEVIEQEAI